jgi:hypothetical protein
MGYGAQGFIPSNELLPYRIDFENDPTATAPAQLVVVTDSLNANIDRSTFQFTEVGFGDHIITIPAGSQHFQTTLTMTYNGLTFDVLIELGLDTSTGLVTATFQSIDPNTNLPPDVLIGFLPPEDGTGRGKGYLSYTALPRAGLPTGTQIRNVATVIFDDNPPITTDQVNEHDPSQGVDPAKQDLNTIDSGAPTSSVTVLPATTTSTTFTVRWSGTDDPGGSGIAFYDVYVSDNGAAFTLFQTSTTTTSAPFTGQVGHTYGFYSVATDNVGNRQVTPTAAQATTQVISPGIPPTETYQVNDGSAQRSMVDSVTLTFSTRVDLDPGAFQLTERQPRGGPIDLSSLLNLGVALDSQGRTVVTLTFAGSGIVGGSLPDGWFDLATIGTKVHDHVTGVALDGAGTGVAGSNQVDSFFRLFGDSLGRGQVDDRDRTAFLAAYRSRRGMPNYRWYFDYFNSGIIDSLAYYQFLRRYKTRLNPDGSITPI